MRQQFITQLKEKATPKHQAFVAKLTPGVSEILGVPMPEIRKIARGIEKESPRAFFSMWEKEISVGAPLYMEEKILWGLVLGHCSMDFHQRMERLSPFIEAIDSWPVCDICKTDLVFLKNEQEHDDFWPILKKYGASKETYPLRFFFVCAMGYYGTPPYLEFAYQVMTREDLPGYYAKMAAAWMMQECYLVEPQVVEQLLREKKIKDPFVHNKGIQKILESRVVSFYCKERLKNFKISSPPAPK